MRTAIAVGLAAGLLLAAPVEASTYLLALESDLDAPPGVEVSIASFPTYEDLIAGTNGTSTFSQMDIADGYSIGGLTFDGQYRLALESDVSVAVDEVAFASFPTFEDLIAGTNGTVTFSQIGLVGDYSIAGLTFDGQYRLMVESNVPAQPGFHTGVVTFPTFDDMVADDDRAFLYSQLTLVDDYSIGGMAYDGQYRLTIEDDQNANAGVELGLLTFPSFQDIIADDNRTFTYSQLGTPNDYSIGGFMWVPEPAPSQIPLPGSLPLLAAALGLIALRRV